MAVEQPASCAAGAGDSIGPGDSSLSLGGELLVLLGKTFLLPQDAARARVLREELVPDLEALNEELEFVEPQRLGTLATALAQAADAPGGFRRVYSRLFLAPPVIAPLNAGIYLDGALMGGSTLAMEECYQRHGLVRDAAFRDLPDHLALQLQFVGYLHLLAAETVDAAERTGLVAEARDFIDQFLLAWLPDLVARLREQASTEAPHLAYFELARLTADALKRVRQTLAARLPATEQASEAPPPTRPTLIEALASRRAEKETADTGAVDDEAEPVHCRRCGQAFALGRDLAFMIQALEAKGLASDHLQVCQDCRAGSMGLSPAGSPPEP